MLSRDCDGCAQLRICGKRYKTVNKGEKVYCSDGTAHLVDQDSIAQAIDLNEQYIDLIQ